MSIELSYIKVGDYYLPNLTLDEPPELNHFIGKYADLRREYLKEHGFVDDIVSRSDMKEYIGRILAMHENKGEFKEVRSFLSLAWENSKCSRFYFPNYYNFGGVRKLNRDYVDKCTSASTQVMVAINDVLEKIESITTTLKNVLKR